MMRIARFVGRAALSSLFIYGGQNQVKNAEYIAGAVEGAADQYGVSLPVSGELTTQISGVTMATLGTALALGVAPRTSAAVLAGMLVPTTVIGHPFWAVEDEAEKTNHLISALKNLSVAGGLLYLAASKAK